ncbi:aspartate kinase [Fodinibius salinus]|uniref:Aspartokinase n=1 Tax=Fodinibius salinus TaxID=860790 RepID=A0A5D3YED6_9BACT|nr:aspartate kinase [Fodinibius salinus]TYP91712.1 aspartate kinase [Fodinibius salinus]
MHVLKFGGTSMGDEDSWRRIIDIINRYEKPVIVVSATARTTRKLVAAAEKALHNLQESHEIADNIKQRHKQLITNFFTEFSNKQPTSDKCINWIDNRIDELKDYLTEVHNTQELTAGSKDAISSIGERLSSYLFAKCATASGRPASWIDAADIIRTDSNFGEANPDMDFIHQHNNRLIDILEEGNIPILGGYYGQDESGRTTTLGFEGSDYTASLIGAALSAEAIEIWTDVSGIFTCDPRLVSQAKSIPQLNFREATELAYFGAKVLHPSTTKPASLNDIPIRVKNIFAPEDAGTVISGDNQTDNGVKAMTSKQDCSILTITSSQTVMGYEFLAGVFDILRWHHLPVDVVTTTEASVSITIGNGHNLDEAAEQLRTFGTVDIINKQGIISLVGCPQKDMQSLIDNVLSSLDTDAVNLVSYSKSKGNLNIVTDEHLIESSVKTIHKRLFD